MQSRPARPGSQMSQKSSGFFPEAAEAEGFSMWRLGRSWYRPCLVELDGGVVSSAEGGCFSGVTIGGPSKPSSPAEGMSSRGTTTCTAQSIFSGGKCKGVSADTFSIKILQPDRIVRSSNKASRTARTHREPVCDKFRFLSWRDKSGKDSRMISVRLGAMAKPRYVATGSQYPQLAAGKKNNETKSCQNGVSDNQQKG